jgi:hypothetical protein
MRRLLLLIAFTVALAGLVTPAQAKQQALTGDATTPAPAFTGGAAPPALKHMGAKSGNLRLPRSVRVRPALGPLAKPPALPGLGTGKSSVPDAPQATCDWWYYGYSWYCGWYDGYIYGDYSWYLYYYCYYGGNSVLSDFYVYDWFYGFAYWYYNTYGYC